MEIKNFLSFEKLLIILILLLFILTQISSFFNVIGWHHDYAITFNGAYRISIGQIPFIDFQSVAPPITFLLTAINFFLFGVSDKQFLLSQIFQNLIFFLIAYKILSKFSSNKLIIFISLYLFTIKYIINLDLPWYNSTAALFLHLSIFFLIKENNLNYLISGFFAALTIYSKQDQGLLLIFFVIFFIIYFEILNKLKFNLLFNKLFLFLLPVITLSLLFYSINPSEFINTMNLYKLATSRLGVHESGGQLRFLPNYQISIILFIFIHLLCFKNNQEFFIILFLLSSSLITSITSGQTLTSLYWYLWPFYLIYKLHKKYNFKFKSNINLLIVLKLILILLITRSIIFSIPESPKIFIKKIIRYPISEKNYNFTNLNSLKNISFKNKDMTKFMEDTVIYINLKNSRYSNKKILNLTLLPINSEINIEPFKNIPLWFHPGVSIFKKEILQINNLIKKQICDFLIISKYDINLDFVLSENLSNYDLIFKSDEYLFYEKKLE